MDDENQASRYERRLLQISLTPDDLAAIREHCKRLDQPMAIWARTVLKAAIGIELDDHQPIKPQDVSSVLEVRVAALEARMAALEVRLSQSDAT